MAACHPPPSSERSGVPGAATTSTSRVARADVCPVRSSHRWSPPVLSHPPTSSALADLTELTRVVADEVRAGLHPVHIDPLRRWYRLLSGDVSRDALLSHRCT